MANIKKTAYFVGSFDGKLLHDDAYQEVGRILRDYGYTVFDDVNTISAEDARARSREEIENYWKLTASRNIDKADIFIAEISEKSTSIGLEIGLAVSDYKPTLLLRVDTKAHDIPVPFIALKSKLTILTYNNKDLETKLVGWLKKVEKGFVTKFMNVGFSKQQIDFVEFIQRREKIKSFALAIRSILDGKIDLASNLEEFNQEKDKKNPVARKF